MCTSCRIMVNIYSPLPPSLLFIVYYFAPPSLPLHVLATHSPSPHPPSSTPPPAHSIPSLQETSYRGRTSIGEPRSGCHLSTRQLAPDGCGGTDRWQSGAEDSTCSHCLHSMPLPLLYTHLAKKDYYGRDHLPEFPPF